MKAEKCNFETLSYRVLLTFEKEGKDYAVDVVYIYQDGYYLRWSVDNEPISQPDWATELEKERSEPIGYILEQMADEEEGK